MSQLGGNHAPVSAKPAEPSARAVSRRSPSATEPAAAAGHQNRLTGNSNGFESPRDFTSYDAQSSGSLNAVPEESWTAMTNFPLLRSLTSARSSEPSPS